LTPATPDHVSTATGKPVASAIRNTLALKLDGKKKNASGNQAVAGNGPISLNTGCSQYPTTRDQPMPTPVTKPTTAPIT